MITFFFLDCMPCNQSIWSLITCKQLRLMALPLFSPHALKVFILDFLGLPCNSVIHLFFSELLPLKRLHHPLLNVYHLSRVYWVSTLNNWFILTNFRQFFMHEPNFWSFCGLQFFLFTQFVECLDLLQTAFNCLALLCSVEKLCILVFLRSSLLWIYFTYPSLVLPGSSSPFSLPIPKLSFTFLFLATAKKRSMSFLI